MSLTKSFRQKVRAVRIRCGINLFLRHAGRVLAIGGGMAILATLIQRVFAVPVLVPWAVWVFWIATAGAILFLWLLWLPSRMQSSLLLDERLKLHERFSTTLALVNCDDPFARSARAESLRTIQQVDLRGHFPVSLSRSCYYGAGTWVVAVMLLLYMPQKDLLGFLTKKQQQQAQSEQLTEARAQVKDALEPVRTMVKELDDPVLLRELAKLDELARTGDPQELKRDAIKVLGDLSEKIKQMETGVRMETGDMLQQMLRQLRGSTDPFAQRIRMALAKGDYKQAVDALRQLQKQLGEGTLSEERRRELAAKLQELAKELQKLSEEKSQVENELERQGLDRKLAQASPEELRKALQKQGLSPEQIDRAMEKIQAAQGASTRCEGLGNAMAGIGVGGEALSAEALSEAIDELDALEALEQQVILLRANLDEISRCVGSLGQGMCDNPGNAGGQGEGIGRAPSDTHEITSDPLTANKVTRAATHAGNDPVVASWYFKDTLIKGEARRSFTEVVQAGRATAAEAISENRIPRRYEEAVKAYFDQLEANGPKP
ncbi:MAG: hypothetical protein JW955_11035 [Sedimentisphaerales bacterium]|nr:hypothetical protein [Sedimentisphaerales bacterium]